MENGLKLKEGTCNLTGDWKEILDEGKKNLTSHLESENGLSGPKNVRNIISYCSYCLRITARLRNKGQQSPKSPRPQVSHTTDLTSRDDSFLLSWLLVVLTSYCLQRAMCWPSGRVTEYSWVGVKILKARLSILPKWARAKEPKDTGPSLVHYSLHVGSITWHFWRAVSV